ALGGAAVGFGVAAGALNESGNLDPGSQDNQQVATTLLIGTAVGAGLGAILGWELLGRNVYHPQAANPLLSAPGSVP
ncbi:MAG: hypothetical protein KJO07_14900, partial [Deltaproteobacteria bacterium]|nr:hypothetical protein [Deltaproteobacteria bacterium]